MEKVSVGREVMAAGKAGGKAGVKDLEAVVAGSRDSLTQLDRWVKTVAESLC